eukprot:TRINITY_DN11178_c0_g1_i1.p1 TRINITY_DN11178_c0_g1~~TRINITY_DN11178_c0_g1_i1.p1  ORF type:complete len:258 (+),score=48.78 TRINITY_DN11178_c0_g1_i1:192-965(+)
MERGAGGRSPPPDDALRPPPGRRGPTAVTGVPTAMAGVHCLPDPSTRTTRRSWRRGPVFCSPFTRAIQTCVLALEGHQALQNKGIVLLGSAREIKKLGGLDTVGKVFGEKIVQRVKEQMALLMNDAEGKLELPCIDVNNAVAEWWTLHSTESQAEIAERFDDFMCTLKYVDAESIIVVGHSLFFLEFLGRYLGPEFRTAKPELSVELRTRKLQNCGCLGLTVDFTQRWPRVVDATLMFGSRLQEERGNMFGRGTPPH